MHLIKAPKPTFLLVLMSSFLSLLASAETPKDRSLTAILSVPTETLCIGTESRDVSATISFTNRSEKNVLLKMSGGRNVTVLGLFGTRTLKPLLSSSMSMSDQGTNGTSSDPVLRPGENINYELRFKLSSEVLTEPGFYKVQVSYDAASLEASHPSPSSDLSGKTNWVILQVHECGDR